MRPTKEQYIRTIANGDDSRDKTVILNFDGTFKLIYEVGADVDANYKYVARGETLVADNDYVGEAAASSENYINPSYAMFLEGWIDYKQHGATMQYLDLHTDESIEDLEGIIDSLQSVMDVALLAEYQKRPEPKLAPGLLYVVCLFLTFPTYPIVPQN